MNCMSKKVKRNKEKLIQKEYQEKLVDLTPEEKKAKDERNLAMRKEIQQLLGAMPPMENNTSNKYTDKRKWRK